MRRIRPCHIAGISFLSPLVFTLTGSHSQKDIPVSRDRRTVSGMQNRVSIRDSRAPRNTWRGVHRKSESSCARDAAQLLPIWPKDLADRSPEGRRKLVALIEREIRKERRRGLACNAAYDVARHARLNHLLKEERRSLSALELSEIGNRVRDGAGQLTHKR